MKIENKKLEQILGKSKKKNRFQNRKYMMHKYWGKKPAKELRELILNYSNEDDLLLDPFAGYGGFSSEAILTNRNVISNDLNPAANFINKCLLLSDIDIEKLEQFYQKIENESREIRTYWYEFEYKGEKAEVISALRNEKGNVIKLKISIASERSFKEISISEDETKLFAEKEKDYVIEEWYPNHRLILNSRISAKKGMTVDDLFDTRSLSSHAKLLSLINELPDSNEKDLLLLAFTSNVANCSKLVPPIRSRGEMAPGAWMTGFYIGETYLENNVFHYFSNRFKKVLAGKGELLDQINYTSGSPSYEVTNYDAKNLSIESQTIDFVFTDFPYGDTVPYFEQSIIWNSWLDLLVQYEEEIVISDSKERNKNIDTFDNDIKKAVDEIYRVLKPNKYFIFTYHSLSGPEWLSITNSLIEAGFKIEEAEMLIQKTFTPRQLNNNRTIKGDMIVVCKKNSIKEKANYLELEEEDIYIQKIFIDILKTGMYETNDIIINFLKIIFTERLVLSKLNIFKELNKIAEYDGKGWIIDGEL